MEEKKELIVPPKLLVLDGLGVILLGIGLAKFLAGVDIIPEGLRFDNYDVFFMVGGAAMMFPAMAHLFGKIKQQNRSN